MDGDRQPPEAAPTGAAVLRSPGVRPVLSLTFLAAVASTLQSVVVLAQVYAITGRPLHLGLVGLAEFVPSALLVLITGTVADRFDRRRIVLAALAVEALCFVGLLGYAGTAPTSVVPIFAIVVVYGAARAFGAPAARSLPPAVAPPGGLSRLVAINSTSWQIATIAGPVLGGVLFEIGPQVAYAAAAGIVGAAMVAVAVARVPPTALTDPGARPSLGMALEGLRLIRRRPVLFGAISLDLFAVLFGGAVALIPAIATERLGVGASGQGLLRAAGGVGASVCAVALAARPFSRHVGRRLFLAVAVFGVATIALGATRTFLVALVAMAVLSAADMVSVFVRATLVPLATPDGTRGRVLAVEQVFIGASNELGAFQSGVAAAILGTAGAVVFGGAATLVVVGLWWRWFPDLRRVDRFGDLEAR